MKIRIVASENELPKVELENGELLGMVTSVDVTIRPSLPAEARLRFLVPEINIHAKATVSEEHLRELAEAHGYNLVKKGE